MGAGWWILSNNQHPEFVAQPGPSSQSATAQPESIQASGTQTPAQKEFLSAALHHAAQTSGPQPLTPETPEAPITTQILEAAVAGYSFTLTTEAERLSAAAPIERLCMAITEFEHLSMADPQISTSFIPQTQNLAPANGNSLFGAPPEVFDGNRAKAKEYMRSFKCWWALNEEKTVFDIPYKQVALCLSYMKGPKIEDWAEAQQEFMNEKKTNGRLANFESHWRDFEKAFKDSFTDIAESVKAENDLKSLRMTSGDINSYIATFMKLLKMAGYQETEHGSLELFKKGLPGGLNIRIINNSASPPSTLRGWIEAVHTEQLKYLQTLECSNKKKPSPQALAIAKCLGVKAHQNNRDPNAMDVDAGNFGRGNFTPLTEGEKQKLRETGGCFQCQKSGHIAKYCPTKSRNAEYGRPAPTQNAHSGITEEPETKKELKDVLADVKAYLSTEENRQGFYDGLIESGFV